MTYIFKQKLKIQDLADVEIKIPKILIYEPHNYLAQLYSHYLTMHNFEAKHCQELNNLLDHIVFFEPQGLVFNVDSQEGIVFAKNIFKKFPNIKVITTAYNISHENIRLVMDFGSISHINRRFSRPVDLPTMLKSIFHQN